MSQWGLTLDGAMALTEAQIDGLLGAWLERKRFEAKIMVSVWGEALKPKEKGQGLMSLSALAAMGFGIEGN
jgi:hypothetical protein